MTTDIEQLRAQAIAAHQQGDLAQAHTGYLAVLRAQPGDAQAWTNLGALLRQNRHYDGALRAQGRAYALNPSSVSVCTNMANILSDTGHYDQSLQLRRVLWQQNPGSFDNAAMIGRCLRGQGRYDEALAWLADKPDHPEIRLQRAFARLCQGDYAQGFRDFQVRWGMAELPERQMDIPEWQGEDIAGKVLMVLPEQGFGDTVLFSRFLPVAAATGARVILPVRKPIERLLAGVRGAQWVGEQLRPDLKPDLWCNLVDLAIPHFEGGAPVPPPAALTLPEAARLRAQQITTPYGDKLKIGVNWCGSVTYKANAFRSFDHTQFLPLTEMPGVQMFSLYKGPKHADFVADGSSALIVDHTGTEADFADCAALIKEMDLVITSDTATAHIAGSLGVPTWVLLHWDPFWVYGHKGQTTPWYPSMWLFRQSEPRDWDGVFVQLRLALEAL